MPLFIPPDKQLVHDWLDEAVSDPEVLRNPDQYPRLPYELNVTEVKTYQRGETVAGPWILPPDQLAG